MVGKPRVRARRQAGDLLDGRIMASHTLTARNWATSSENRIHDDEVAQRYGFRGGLVPGVTLFAYLVPAIVADQGEPWLEGGFVDVRFAAPVTKAAS